MESNVAELTQTKEFLGFLFQAARTAISIREGGVEVHEITDGLAPGPFKDSLTAALDGAPQIGPELRSIEAGDWEGGADLLAFIATQAQTLAPSN
jgi:hypothetical protein